MKRVDGVEGDASEEMGEGVNWAKGAEGGKGME